VFFFKPKNLRKLEFHFFSSVNLTSGKKEKTLHPILPLKHWKISHNAPNRFSNAKIRLNINECILNSQLSNTFKMPKIITQEFLIILKICQTKSTTRSESKPTNSNGKDKKEKKGGILIMMYYWIRRNGSRIDRCQGKKRSYYRNWLQGNPTFPPFLQCLQSVTKLFFLFHDSWGIGPTHSFFNVKRFYYSHLQKRFVFFSQADKHWKTIWKHHLTSTTCWLMSYFKKQKEGWTD